MSHGKVLVFSVLAVALLSIPSMASAQVASQLEWRLNALMGTSTMHPTIVPPAVTTGLTGLLAECFLEPGHGSWRRRILCQCRQPL